MASYYLVGFRSGNKNHPLITTGIERYKPICGHVVFSQSRTRFARFSFRPWSCLPIPPRVEWLEVDDCSLTVNPGRNGRAGTDYCSCSCFRRTFGHCLPNHRVGARSRGSLARKCCRRQAARRAQSPFSVDEGEGAEVDLAAITDMPVSRSIHSPCSFSWSSLTSPDPDPSAPESGRRVAPPREST